LIDPGPTCHTPISPFLSLIGRAHSRDGPTRRPPRSLFSLPRTRPLSPLLSPARDVRTACPAPLLSGQCCPTTPSLAQPRPALKPPPPSAILPRPSPSRHHYVCPASTVTPLPRPTAGRGPQRLIITVSSLPLSGTRLGSRSLSLEQGPGAAPSTPHSPKRCDAATRDGCRRAGSALCRPIPWS
jgi:hypothetical protein